MNALVIGGVTIDVPLKNRQLPPLTDRDSPDMFKMGPNELSLRGIAHWLTYETRLSCVTVVMSG